MADRDHLLSPAERAFCSSQQSRWQVLYLAAKDFQAFPTIENWKKTTLIWPVTWHAHLVNSAGAFTNCVWPSTSTFQVDKQNVWTALSKHGDEGFGSLFSRFQEVPFSAVTLEYFLLLPVSAIIGYLLHHHISFQETRWFHSGQHTEIIHFSSCDKGSLHRLGILPDRYGTLFARNRVSAKRQLRTNTVQYSCGFGPVNDPRCYHVRAISLSSRALIRAAEFAFSETYSGDMFEQCSAKWAVLLYFIKTGHFPANNGTDYRPDYDMVDCLTGLIDNSQEKFTRLFGYTRILHGPYRHLPHFLSEHALAIALYGTSVHTVTVGVQRLMVAGCLLYFYMLLHGRRYVDNSFFEDG
jgi:hypothetical protein